jgi:uncharacterized membrane protein YfhO
MLYYKGYRVVDENGNQYNIEDGTNHVIKFELPAHFKGKIQIQFVSPLYWRVAEIVSIGAWVLLFLLVCKRKMPKKRSLIKSGRDR